MYSVGEPHIKIFVHHFHDIHKIHFTITIVNIDAIKVLESEKTNLMCLSMSIYTCIHDLIYSNLLHFFTHLCFCCFQFLFELSDIKFQLCILFVKQFQLSFHLQRYQKEKKDKVNHLREMIYSKKLYFLFIVTFH